MRRNGFFVTVQAPWWGRRGSGINLSSMQSSYFRRGFGLSKEVEPLVQAEYHSHLLTRIRAAGNVESFGPQEKRVTV